MYDTKSSPNHSDLRPKSDLRLYLTLFGGAIFYETNYDTASLVIQSSFFWGCFAEIQGGALSIASGGSCTVTDCVIGGPEEEVMSGGCFYFDFFNSQVQLSRCRLSYGTSGRGGGLHIARSKVSSVIEISFCHFLMCMSNSGGGLYFWQTDGGVSVKDSLFDECSSGYGGGGIGIEWTTSFHLDSVKFRNCTAYVGRDVFIANLTRATVVNGNMIVGCVTMLGIGNVYFADEKKADNSLIPQVASLYLINSSFKLSLSGDDVGGTLTATTSESVEGRLLVVLDNSGSQYEMPNVDSPPPIDRLIIFDFPTPSTTSSQSILFNEWNTLQYESNFTVMLQFLYGASLSLLPSLRTPNPPRIVELLTNSSKSDPEHFTLQLKGRSLSAGNYNVKLKGVPDLSIVVSFTGHPTSPTESRNMLSTKPVLTNS
ncbi:hypothetical protein BLNAU_3440 [Blattamonas nauphoetae]|uniref:Right handed beta helix domain-containing protein n=1 Tax=Blattamonas nauphoetae TaxID=2049346 RepID=A0ABQ9YD23_9EUKA|nr:hypothetical protein BLNAU_3440 [Blattamonas nauphoetae]